MYHACLAILVQDRGNNAVGTSARSGSVNIHMTHPAHIEVRGPDVADALTSCRLRDANIVVTIQPVLCRHALAGSELHARSNVQLRETVARVSGQRASRPSVSPA